MVRSAFEVLYDRHHRGVLSFCRHMLGSPEDAEDAVQHTFSAAYRALLRDDRKIALSAWLYAIARNRCLSLLATRREQVALDDVETELPSTTGLAAQVEQRSDLRALLADLHRLPADQRAALVLAELEVHDHKEIAAILGVPQPKVKALVFQARETLMSARQARETDCAQIREQLSVLSGGALRRSNLRRHLECCPGCRAFEAEVRRQRTGMALLLPVAPTMALKDGALTAAFTTSTTSAAAGLASVAGADAVGGAIATGVKTTTAKLLAALAVTGGAGAGGYVAATGDARDNRRPARPQVHVQHPGTAPAAPSAATPVMSPTGPTRTVVGRPSAAAAAGLAALDGHGLGLGLAADRSSDGSDGRAEAGTGQAPNPSTDPPMTGSGDAPAADPGDAPDVGHGDAPAPDADASAPEPVPMSGSSRGKGRPAKPAAQQRRLDKRHTQQLLRALRKLQHDAQQRALGKREARELLGALAKLERELQQRAVDKRQAHELLRALAKLEREVQRALDKRQARELLPRAPGQHEDGPEGEAHQRARDDRDRRELLRALRELQDRAAVIG